MGSYDDAVPLKDSARTEHSDPSELETQPLQSTSDEDIKEIRGEKNARSPKDFIGTLPDEIAMNILSNLSGEDIVSASHVSKAWSLRCNNQALWKIVCELNDPPIPCTTDTTWEDLVEHHVMMRREPSPLGMIEEGVNKALNTDDNHGHYDSIISQGPSSNHHSRPKDKQTTTDAVYPSPAIASDTGVAGPSPTVNYKHLFLVNKMLAERVRDKGKSIKPLILDSKSSYQAGGLPGHRMAIWALEIVRHRMKITNSYEGTCADETEEIDRRRSTHYEGRNWLLSGSMDKTLKLWQLDTAHPRVVKDFRVTHTSMILTICSVLLPATDLKKAPKGSEVPALRLVAITGGGDGLICLWDVQRSRKPIKVVRAHRGPVACVKADQRHVVSVSRGGPGVNPSIKVFSLPNMDETLSISLHEDDADSVTFIDIFGEHIISGSSDGTLRVWCIHTGAQLHSAKSNVGEISSIAFEPSWEDRRKRKQNRCSDTGIRGTIFIVCSGDRTDWSDWSGTVEMFDLISTQMSESAPCADDTGGRCDANHNVRLEYRITAPGPCRCPSASFISPGENCKHCHNLGHDTAVTYMCVTPFAALSSSDDGMIITWDKKNARAYKQFTNGDERRFSTAVAGNRLFIAVGGAVGAISLWNLGQGMDTAFVQP